jgi:hypothetical protein
MWEVHIQAAKAAAEIAKKQQEEHDIKEYRKTLQFKVSRSYERFYPLSYVTTSN